MNPFAFAASKTVPQGSLSSLTPIAPLSVLIPHEYAVAVEAESGTYESLDFVRIPPINMLSIGRPCVALFFQCTKSRAIVSEAVPNPSLRGNEQYAVSLPSACPSLTIDYKTICNLRDDLIRHKLAPESQMRFPINKQWMHAWVNICTMSHTMMKFLALSRLFHPAPKLVPMNPHSATKNSPLSRIIAAVMFVAAGN